MLFYAGPIYCYKPVLYTHISRSYILLSAVPIDSYMQGLYILLYAGVAYSYMAFLYTLICWSYILLYASPSFYYMPDLHTFIF